MRTQTAPAAMRTRTLSSANLCRHCEICTSSGWPDSQVASRKIGEQPQHTCKKTHTHTIMRAIPGAHAKRNIYIRMGRKANVRYIICDADNTVDITFATPESHPVFYAIVFCLLGLRLVCCVFLVQIKTRSMQVTHPETEQYKMYVSTRKRAQLV